MKGFGFLLFCFIIAWVLSSCAGNPAGLWTGEKGAESYSLSLAKDGRYLMSGVNPAGQLFEDRGQWVVSNKNLFAHSDQGVDRKWVILTLNGKQLLLKNKNVPEGNAGDLLDLHPADTKDFLGIWYSQGGKINLALYRIGYGIYGINPQDKSFVDLGTWEYSDGMLIAKSQDGNLRSWDVILLGADKLVIKSREVKESEFAAETVYNRVDPSEFYGTWLQGGGTISFLNEKNYVADGMDGVGSAGSYQYSGNKLTLHPAGGEDVTYEIKTYGYNRIALTKNGSVDEIIWERSANK